MSKIVLVMYSEVNRLMTCISVGENKRRLPVHRRSNGEASVRTSRAPDLEDGDLVSLDEEAHAYPGHRPVLAQGEGQTEACLCNVH